MEKTLLQQLEVYHNLRSKETKNGKILILLDFDYYLHKRDFRILSGQFERITMIPIEESNKLKNGADFSRFLYKSSNNFLIIYNPAYQEIYGNKLNLDLNKDNKIETLNVFDFCEKYLKKCYVSENLYVKNPALDNLKYFGLRTRLIKKSVDWGIGGVLYILSQPLWLISGFKIYSESPGPIFFRQERVGIRNHEIKVIKFRSMKLDAEKEGAQFSKKNDDRIFPWGKIMRATRIDELPQLFNILKGELSLIGPRPERKVFIDSFKEEIPQYAERHTVKPGISGYAQIMYPYGAGTKDARHKLMYDLYYIKNWTITLEVKILLKTIFIVITKKGL